MSQSPIGVVIVTFQSGHEAVDCAASVFASAAAGGVPVKVVIVDNASDDDTLSRVRDWADGTTPYSVPQNVPFEMTPPPVPLALTEGKPDLEADQDADIVLIRSTENLGFAGGVNIGLKHLALHDDIGTFWILNPDTMIPSDALTIAAAGIAATPEFSLMGGRVVYLDDPDLIQIDGGLLNSRTGVTSNYNLGASHATALPPAPQNLDFIMGASMLVSRAFYEAAGPLDESYFLYYEEVDWAMRRGNLPLAYCKDLLVYHHGGTSIGSPVYGRSASVFSLYFKHRSRIMFQRRHNPNSRFTTYLYSTLQAGREVWRGSPQGASAILRAIFGLGAPASVKRRIGDKAWARISSRKP